MKEIAIIFIKAADLPFLMKGLDASFIKAQDAAGKLRKVGILLLAILRSASTCDFSEWAFSRGDETTR